MEVATTLVMHCSYDSPALGSHSEDQRNLWTIIIAFLEPPASKEGVRQLFSCILVIYIYIHLQTFHIPHAIHCVYELCALKENIMQFLFYNLTIYLNGNHFQVGFQCVCIMNWELRTRRNYPYPETLLVERGVLRNTAPCGLILSKCLAARTALSYGRWPRIILMNNLHVMLQSRGDIQPTLVKTGDLGNNKYPNCCSSSYSSSVQYTFSFSSVSTRMDWSCAAGWASMLRRNF